MTAKWKYETPVLIDMRNDGPCGAFAATCSYGSNVSRTGECNLGSCPDQAICQTGTATETCSPTGNSACGCDACCGEGNSVAPSGGSWTMSDCYCNTGATAGRSCNTYGGHALTNNCFTGEIAYTNCV